MKLLGNEIQKNLELEEQFLQRKWYKKHVWKHSVAYNIALNLLRLKDKNPKIKNSLWKRFLLSPDSVDSRRYLKLQKFMSQHNAVINRAFQLISETTGDNIYEEGQIFRRTKALAPIGVLAFELPE